MTLRRTVIGRMLAGLSAGLAACRELTWLGRAQGLITDDRALRHAHGTAITP